MYATIKDLHSYWAFAVLVLLLLAAINAFVGISSKKVFTKKDRQISLIALIFSHVQLVIGLIMYVLSPWLAAAKAGGMGAAMKDSTLRLYLVEHPIINIIAIALITIGWSKHKKETTDLGKFKKIGYLYAVAFVLLLSRIPWSAWLS
jgi:hypothetical protein